MFHTDGGPTLQRIFLKGIFGSRLHLLCRCHSQGDIVPHVIIPNQSTINKEISFSVTTGDPTYVQHFGEAEVVCACVILEGFKNNDFNVTSLF